MDQIEGARFGSEHVSSIEFPEREGTEAERIAHADNFAFAHNNKRERALDPPQCAQHARAVVRGLSQQMQNDFAISRGLKNGAFAFQLVAQKVGVNQIAVMRNRHLAAETIDHERLRVFQCARAGGRIARVPERARAFQFFQLIRAENLRDQAHVAMKLEGRTGPVARHDAGALLPAMLQREEAVVSQHRRIRMAEDREDAAFVCGVGRGLAHDILYCFWRRLRIFDDVSDRIEPVVIDFSDWPGECFFVDSNRKILSADRPKFSKWNSCVP